MPELPDVEGYRRILHDHGLHEPIDELNVPDPAVLRNSTIARARRSLVGESILGDERRGKWLIASLERVHVVFHFGMTGRLEWLEPHDEIGRFVRLRLGFASGSLVYHDPRRLRGVWVARDGSEVQKILGPLGPDALGLSFAALDSALAVRRGAIKTTLMDQRVLAGIGNMLSDELLWRARVNPRRTARELSLDERRALHRAFGSVVDNSARVGSIPRKRTWLNSQRDQREPRCPRGHGELRRSKIGGRTALWCPVCQPEDD